MLGWTSLYVCRVNYFFYQFVVIVEFGSVKKSSSPGKDRGDGISRRLLALLVHAVVAGHGAVSS